MNIVFFGSDDFATVHLESLIGSTHEVVACVTQPDRPKGRGMKVIVSPVKECAARNSVPVFQPTSFKDEGFVEALKQFEAEVFVVIAYGRFLSQEVLDIPTQCAINVHGSLLPKYRGAAPINWAIIKGESETGLSIIKMNVQMDAGAVLAQEKILIEAEDTSVTLRAKMMQSGPSLLLKTMEDLMGGSAVCVQDTTAVTFAPKLTKELGHIQWEQSAEEIHNLVRGLLPWPTAYTFYKGKLLKILATEIVERDDEDCKPGEIIEISKDGFIVTTGLNRKQTSGVCVGSDFTQTPEVCLRLLIKQVQLEGGKVMDAYSFTLGHKVEIGLLLGRV